MKEVIYFNTDVINHIKTISITDEFWPHFKKIVEQGAAFIGGKSGLIITIEFKEKPIK